MKSFILVFFSLFLLQKITNTAYTKKARSNVDTANVNDIILVTPTIADRAISHLVLLFRCLRSGYRLGTCTKSPTRTRGRWADLFDC